MLQIIVDNVALRSISPNFPQGKFLTLERNDERLIVVCVEVREREREAYKCFEAFVLPSLIFLP